MAAISRTGSAARSEPVDLYLAHFLGAGGAARFLRAHDANPDAAAAPLLPAAARANRPVFYNRDGSMRSFAEIRARFAEKIATGSQSGGAIDHARAGPPSTPAPSFLDDTVRTARSTATCRCRGSARSTPIRSIRELTGMDADALAFARLGSTIRTGSILTPAGARPRPRPTAGPSPRYARLAYMMLAQLGGSVPDES